MVTQPTGCRKILTCGCLGCLAVLVFSLIISAVIFAVAWSMSRNENVERSLLTRPLPGPAPQAVTEDQDPVQALSAEDTAGTVVLDLQGATFKIRPAAPGDPLTVDAEFDTTTYEMTERFQEPLGDEGWVYELDFGRPSRSYLMTTLKELLTGTRPDVTIFLPRDLPFDLELRFQQGGGDVELGGLHLVNAEIEFLQGGGAVEISRPLEAPMDSLSVDFIQGGGAIEGIGNASPGRLDVGFAMGGGFVGLRGPWRNDAEISLRQRMGGMTVQLPRDVRTSGIPRPGIRPPSQEEVPRPMLRFRTSKQYGDIEILD